MTDVADLSPGTVLRAGTTGWTYRVQADNGDRVIVSGPNGSMGVDRDELQRDIARGTVEVLS
jgi:hypothetical protein